MALRLCQRLRRTSRPQLGRPYFKALVVAVPSISALSIGCGKIVVRQLETPRNHKARRSRSEECYHDAWAARRFVGLAGERRGETRARSRSSRTMSIGTWIEYRQYMVSVDSNDPFSK